MWKNIAPPLKSMRKKFEPSWRVKYHFQKSWRVKGPVTWFETICFFSSYSVYCALNLSCGSFKIISLVRMVLVLWSNRFAVKTDQTTKLKKMTSLKEENIIIKILNVKIIVSSQTVASILTNKLGLKRQPKGDWELIFLQTFRP